MVFQRGSVLLWLSMVRTKERSSSCTATTLPSAGLAGPLCTSQRCCGAAQCQSWPDRPWLDTTSAPDSAGPCHEDGELFPSRNRAASGVPSVHCTSTSSPAVAAGDRPVKDKLLPPLLHTLCPALVGLNSTDAHQLRAQGSRTHKNAMPL